MRRSMSTPLSILLVSAFLMPLMFISCTTYYKTSDLKKTFNQNQREVNKTLGQIAKDRREKRGIYTQLITRAPDSTAAPYPALAAELAVMTTTFKQIKRTVNKMEKTKVRLNNLVKGKKKLESNSPAWDEFQQIKTDYDSQGETFNSLVGTYQAASNRFISLLNDNKFVRLQVVELRQQIDSYMSQLDHSIQQISTQLEEFRKDPQASKSTLGKMDKTLANIRTERDAMQKMIATFEKEVGSEPQVWAGPGMLSYTILQDLRRTGKKITTQGEAFNQLAKSLK